MDTNKPYLKLKNKTSVVDAVIVNRCKDLKEAYDVIMIAIPGYNGAEYAVFYSNKNRINNPKDWKLDKLLGIVYAEKQSCDFIGWRTALIVKNVPGDTMNAIVMFARVIGLEVLII